MKQVRNLEMQNNLLNLKWYKTGFFGGNHQTKPDI